MISGTLATHDGLLHWLVRCDLSSASIAPDSSPDYLSTEEIKLWKSLRTDKRRRDWLLGRSTAKQLIADMLRERIDRKLPLDEITIRPHADGWPMVELHRPYCQLQFNTMHLARITTGRAAGARHCRISRRAPKMWRPGKNRGR